MTTQSIDPVTAEPFGPLLPDTSPAELDRLLAAAAELGELPSKPRLRLLRAVADRLDAEVEPLVKLAAAESGLSAGVLTAELARTTFQLRQFADQAAAGSYLGVRIDRASAAPLPAGHPDLRRMLVPIGPVAIFGASNFPFAFGVAGGDTAAAFAAGCPVLVKAHPAHPQLSEALAELIAEEVASSELPRGSFGLVRGMAAARNLVVDQRIRAGAFTGSAAGGRALFDLAASRPDPIPFFAELGSVNPVFVTPAGAADPDALARGWVDSLLVRAGQMCTNPGLLIVPAGSAVAERGAELLGAVEPGPLLTPGIARAYLEHVGIVGAITGASVLRAPSAGRGATVSPGLIRLPAAAAFAAIDEVQTECFGPSGVVIEYATPDEALSLAGRLHGTLVASVHGDAGEQLAAALVPALARIAGRVLWNGWPTGVAVVPAQQHGGPWPATTNSQYTSVGAAAIHRFLRPVAYQDMPAVLLPPQLRDPDGAE